MAKLRRTYKPQVIKRLFALCNNTCAFPGCTSPIFEPGSDVSDDIITGQICHIFALSENGPRGKAGLTQKELNSYDNLIVCCAHHHNIIDKQPNDYPAELLIQWKKTHESRALQKKSLVLIASQQSPFHHQIFPKELVDEKLATEIDLLRKSRFFSSFDRVGHAERLAKDVLDGTYSGASDARRCKALAWCARILSVTDRADDAKEFLNSAKVLGACNEIGIAEAFIVSRNEGKVSSLRILNGLDCSEARSASLMIVTTEDGIEVGEKWLEEAGISRSDLDADGKFFLLNNLLQISRWESANSCLGSITDVDCQNAPLLLRTIALTHLINAINIELRPLVVGQIPFDARRFPLSSTPEGLESLSQARRYFTLAASAERELGFSDAASFCDDYVLWLELRDQKLSDQALQKLEADLKSPAKGLRLVSLGLEFGIKVNKEVVEKEIARQTALNGEITFDAAIARFSLCFMADSEAEVARALEDHKAVLARHIDMTHISRIQTEMYARSGQLEKARECLSELKNRGLDDDDLRRIKRLVDSAEGTDKVETLIREYSQSGHINDLDILSEELGEQGRYEELIRYAKEYFDQTRSLKAASRYATALFNTHDYASVVRYIKENEFFLGQSDYLRLLYSWALYHEGLLNDAGAELGKVGKDYKEAEVRLLTINLAISSGDWNSITVTLAHEYEKIAERTDEELIQLAKLAYQAGSPYAKDFLFRAAEKGAENSKILTNAYLIATEEGIENSESVARWLSKAIELSDDSGPMRMMSLSEIVKLKPDWDSRSADVWEKIAQAEAPLFVAGEVLNRTLIELMLSPAIANQRKRDIREKPLIPAYSGKRLIENTAGIEVVGFDAAALLTISLLGIVDKVLSGFQKIYIPHSTLGWLFAEKQKASFHQPSKIKDAHEIRHLVSECDLSVLEPRLPADSDLTALVGEELSQLLTEARNMCGNDDNSALVIRSSPVRQVGSYTDNEADLSSYADLLCGCQVVINKLYELGQISESEKAEMSAYLSRHEAPWPNQPVLPEGATLMLDGLSVAYFQHLRVLDKLKQAGFRVFISKREIAEANSLISFENSSAKVRDAIEELRSALSRGIAAGRIFLGRRIVSDKDDEGAYSNHPSYGAISLADTCDAVVFDDRFVNKNVNVQGNVKTVRALTSLDLLYGLKERKAISNIEFNSYKAVLRKAGYVFVGLEEEELLSYVLASGVKEGRLIETLELKAVRDSILRIRMSRWLTLPEEAPWIADHFRILSSVLKRVWQESADKDIEGTKVRSNWLLEFLDIRGWAHSLPGDQAEQIGNAGRLNHVMLVVALPPELPESIRETYWAWLDEQIVLPIKEEHPELYALILKFQKTYIDHVVNSDLSRDEKSIPSQYMKAKLFEAVIALLSPTIADSLVRDGEFRKHYGVTETAMLNIGSTGIQVDRSIFISGIRSILSGEGEAECLDSEGKVFRLRKAEGSQEIIQLNSEDESLQIALPGFFQFSPVMETRLSGLQRLADEVNLPLEDKNKWESILEQRALSDEEFEIFNEEFQDTPVRIFEAIGSSIRSGKSSISDLVPQSARYYERLVGKYDGSLSIHEYIENVLKSHIASLYRSNKSDGLSHTLLLSSHPAISPLSSLPDVDTYTLTEKFESLNIDGDTTSIIGAIELGFTILSIRPQLEGALVRLIEKLRDEKVDENAEGIPLFAALVALVDGELSRIKIFRNTPPFYRRLASLSHAAAIHRQAIRLRMKGDGIINWAYEKRGAQYFVQVFADMRLEQRWSPDYLSPSKIKANLMGRVLTAAIANRQGIEGNQVYKMVVGEEQGTIQSICSFPNSYFPGPLEGGDTPVLDIPKDLDETIKEYLESGELSPQKLYPLLNAALIFKTEVAYAEKVGIILKDHRYHIGNVESKEQLFSLLAGIAKLSAITRCVSLADELRIALRAYRHDEHFKLTVDEVLNVALEAAASRADILPWCQYVGDIFSDLAFSSLSSSEAVSVRYYLEAISDAVPEIWNFSSRADAALHLLVS